MNLALLTQTSPKKNAQDGRGIRRAPPKGPTSSFAPWRSAAAPFALVYAFDTEASQYLASRDFLDAARRGATTLFVTSHVLCEFYAIVTNARRVVKPRSRAEAVAAITDLLSFLHVLPIPARAVEGWIDLLHSRPVRGGAVFDLQIVAAMLANGIQRIYAFKTHDFTPFSEIENLTP